MQSICFWSSALEPVGLSQLWPRVSMCPDPQLGATAQGSAGGSQLQWEEDGDSLWFWKGCTTGVPSLGFSGFSFFICSLDPTSALASVAKSRRWPRACCSSRIWDGCPSMEPATSRTRLGTISQECPKGSRSWRILFSLRHVPWISTLRYATSLPLVQARSADESQGLHHDAGEAPHGGGASGRSHALSATDRASQHWPIDSGDGRALQAPKSELLGLGMLRV